MTPRARRLTLDEYAEGVRANDRATLARAITLVESRRSDDQALAQELLTRLMPFTGGAQRVGVTGVPGVGKSTFIETLGTNLTALGHKVAVLAVDPSSTRSGGSILGDKTRMERLARDPSAFIRPSPTSGTLGGVAAKTRETLLLCEAAGYDVVLVETVGVGQSELVVAQMTDFYLVLVLAGAGDELQGIKRGVLELADAIVVTKADGDNVERARKAAQTYRSALRVTHPADGGWQPRVLLSSALENHGLDAVWKSVTDHHAETRASGAYEAKRAEQQLEWLWSLVDDRLRQLFREHPDVEADFPQLEREVREGRLAPTTAARRLIERFRGGV